IFSQLNPGEKLVVGCRKAAVAVDVQEGKTPAANGVAGGTSGGNGNLPVDLEYGKVEFGKFTLEFQKTNKLDKAEAALHNEI
nr:B3 domain-containing transcription repressor VAL1-like isoform X1 [Tanacetum cinerariifolium]